MTQKLPRDDAEWRPIPGFPEYEVSRSGAVRSWRQPLGGRKHPYPLPHTLSRNVNRDGYEMVTVRKTGDKTPHKIGVHRLVALAYVPNPDGLPQVAHRDGVPSNNQDANLRWSTARDNALDMRKHGTIHDGERSPRAKLSEKDAGEIVRLHKRGRSQACLANEYGVHTSQVSRIVNGLRWSGVLGVQQ